MAWAARAARATRDERIDPRILGIKSQKFSVEVKISAALTVRLLRMRTIEFDLRMILELPASRSSVIYSTA